MAQRKPLHLYLGRKGGAIMFEISTNWLNGAVQVIAYALIIGAGLWLLSKIQIKEKEGKK